MTKETFVRDKVFKCMGCGDVQVVDGTFEGEMDGCCRHFEVRLMGLEDVNDNRDVHRVVDDYVLQTAENNRTSAGIKIYTIRGRARPAPAS